MSLSVHDVDFRGACLCGDVSFHGRGLRDIVHCHCRQCLHGHGAVAAYTATKYENLSITSSGALRWYQSSNLARRGFCRRCAASLFWHRIDARQICIAASALDQGYKLRPARHIFVANIPTYDVITDRLDCYRGSMATSGAADLD